MNRTCMKTTTVLAFLLISLISISTAAGLKASSDYYSGQCGVELSVPAPGILKNDVANPSLVQVVNPGSITIDPKYGTITVNADGSFVYDVPENIGTSAIVTFTYTMTDGMTVSNSATVKITVSCRCHGAAPDVTACPGTEITPEFLMSKGAGCFGCDSTGTFGLSQIPADPVAGETYTYTVSCSGCALLTGHVTFAGPCSIASVPFTVCSGITPTTAMILAQGSVTCSCDAAPVISDIHLVGDHWEYTITCQSVCGPVTEAGRVNIEAPCTITTDNTFTVCSGVTPTAEEIQAHVACSCGTPVIANIVKNEAGTAWTYDVSCTSALGCTSTVTGEVQIEAPCTITPDDSFTVCSGVTPTAAEIGAHVACSCGDPVVTNIVKNEAGTAWTYDVSCTSALGCTVTATGEVQIEAPCTITPDDSFTVCSGVTPTAAEIGAHVACSCGDPVVTNIVKNEAGTAWTYDVSCTSALGCTATATGEVQIEAPCTITPDDSFTVCSGVTPTAAEIGAHVACSCGDPVVTNIVKNEAGTAWTYDVSCTSALGCTATATGEVQIEAPCTITPDDSFTVCSGVTPTAAEIGAHVACSCGDPVVTNIVKNEAGTAWTYDVSCTSALGCTVTATGDVQIEAPCDISFAGFPILPDNCPNHDLPTSDEVIDLGAVDCGCDASPVITNIHWVEPTPETPDQWVGEYTVTCTPGNGCPASSEIGEFTSEDCTVDKCIGVVCDDGNQCTDDSCDPATGECQYINKPDQTPCDLNVECAEDVYCDGGFCLGHFNRCADINDPEHCRESGSCNGYHCCTNPDTPYCVKNCGTDCPPIVDGPQSGTCIT